MGKKKETVHVVLPVDDFRLIHEMVRLDPLGMNSDPALQRRLKRVLQSLVMGVEPAPRVLVQVSGGVADVNDVGPVRVCVIDYDNDPDAKIPKEFRGLGPKEGS